MSYAIVTDRSELKGGKQPAGHRLVHKTLSFGMVLVPLMSQPFAEPMQCPTCQVAHPVKTIHLNLEMGAVIVSQGVLTQMRTAGTLEELGFDYDKVVVNPPPLKLDGRSRAEIDQANRRIVVHGKIGKEQPNG